MAVEKGTGKASEIKITNDREGLSQADVERMVREAEEYKAEDEANRARVEAKNRLENLAYTFKNAVGDEAAAASSARATGRPCSPRSRRSVGGWTRPRAPMRPWRSTRRSRRTSRPSAML